MFQTIGRWSHNLIQHVWCHLRPHLILCVWDFLCINILLGFVESYEKQIKSRSEIPQSSSKGELCYAGPTLTQRSDYLMHFSNTQVLRRGLSAWENDMHLMLALNAPNDHFHHMNIKWRYLLVVGQEILEDEAYINQKLWRLNTIKSKKKFIILSAKWILYILVKL